MQLLHFLKLWLEPASPKKKIEESIFDISTSVFFFLRVMDFLRGANFWFMYFSLLWISKITRERIFVFWWIMIHQFLIMYISHFFAETEFLTNQKWIWHHAGVSWIILHSENPHSKNPHCENPQQWFSPNICINFNKKRHHLITCDTIIQIIKITSKFMWGLSLWRIIQVRS